MVVATTRRRSSRTTPTVPPFEAVTPSGPNNYWTDYYGDNYLEDDKWLTVNGYVRTFTIGPTVSASYSASSITASRKKLPAIPTKTASSSTTPFMLKTSSFLPAAVSSSSSRRYNIGGGSIFQTSTVKEPSLFLYANEIEFENGNNNDDFSLFDASPPPNRFAGTVSYNATLTAPPTTSSTTDQLMSLDDTCQLGVGEMLAVTVMILLTLSTICMNIIVIFLFLSNKHIRSLGNMYYMSLACADLLIGSTAMPLNIYMQLMCDYWPFSSIACDLFISFDVLSSTASIMHLCVIAIDRYKVIDDPLGYVRRLSRKRVFATIGGIWLTASAISFPGIAWWKVAGMAEHNTAFVDAKTGDVYLECYLAHEVTYIFLSSAVSFYIPLIAMSTVYYKIYQKAVAQSRFLTAGSKNVVTGDVRKTSKRAASNGSGGGGNNGGETTYASKLAGRITLRAHRGGQAPLMLSTTAAAALRLNSTPILMPSPHSYTLRNDSNCATPDNASLYGNKRAPPSSAFNKASRASKAVARKPSSLFNYPRSFTTFQKLKTILKEHKAARTLGLIMGVFILCWLPFFVLNILSAVIPSELTDSLAFKTIFKTFTWCGYMNSVLNPFLYGVSNRTFRNIYINFLTCGRKKNAKKGSSTSSLTTSRGSAAPNKKEIRTFRPASLPRGEQNLLEAALRDPRQHTTKQIQQQRSPVSAVLPTLPKHIVFCPDKPALSETALTPSPAHTLKPDVIKSDPAVNNYTDVMSRSLTIELPKRVIGHHSCFCQCADEKHHVCNEELMLLNNSHHTVSTSTPVFPPISPQGVRTRPPSGNKAAKGTEVVTAGEKPCTSLTNTPRPTRKKIADSVFRNSSSVKKSTLIVSNIPRPPSFPLNNNDKKAPLAKDAETTLSFDSPSSPNSCNLIKTQTFIVGSPTSTTSPTKRSEDETIACRIHSSLVPLNSPTKVPNLEENERALLIVDDCYDNGFLTVALSKEQQAQKSSHCPLCNADMMEKLNSGSLSTATSVSKEPSPAHCGMSFRVVAASPLVTHRTLSPDGAPVDLSLKPTSVSTAGSKSISRTSVV